VRVRLTPRVGVGFRGLMAIGGEVAHSQFYDLSAIYHLTSRGVPPFCDSSRRTS
jgi:hypothetical protein